MPRDRALVETDDLSEISSLMDHKVMPRDRALVETDDLSEISSLMDH